MGSRSRERFLFHTRTALRLSEIYILMVFSCAHTPFAAQKLTPPQVAPFGHKWVRGKGRRMKKMWVINIHLAFKIFFLHPFSAVFGGTFEDPIITRKINWVCSLIYTCCYVLLFCGAKKRRLTKRKKGPKLALFLMVFLISKWGGRDRS